MRRCLAFANLAWRFALHIVGSLARLLGRGEKGLEKFRKNYRDDKIWSLSPVEREEMPCYDECMSCGACSVDALVLAEYGVRGVAVPEAEVEAAQSEVVKQILETGRRPGIRVRFRAHSPQAASDCISRSLTELPLAAGCVCEFPLRFHCHCCSKMERAREFIRRHGPRPFQRESHA